MAATPLLNSIKPLWEAWDKAGAPCPRHKGGWMSYYAELVVVKLPFLDYAKPIWEAWDARGFPCPKHKDGWMAYHTLLVKEGVVATI